MAVFHSIDLSPRSPPLEDSIVSRRRTYTCILIAYMHIQAMSVCLSVCLSYGVGHERGDDCGGADCAAHLWRILFCLVRLSCAPSIFSTLTHTLSFSFLGSAHSRPILPGQSRLETTDYILLFGTGGSMLNLPCSQVASTSPSLCRFITPLMVANVLPMLTISHSIKIFSPTGIGFR